MGIQALGSFEEEKEDTHQPSGSRSGFVYLFFDQTEMQCLWVPRFRVHSTGEPLKRPCWSLYSLQFMFLGSIFLTQMPL